MGRDVSQGGREERLIDDVEIESILQATDLKILIPS